MRPDVYRTDGARMGERCPRVECRGYLNWRSGVQRDRGYVDHDRNSRTEEWECKECGQVFSREFKWTRVARQDVNKAKGRE